MKLLNFKPTDYLGSKLSEFQTINFLSDYFDQSSIEEIASFYYLSNKSAGISVAYNQEKRLIAIQFYFNGKDGYQDFEGRLPFGINSLDRLETINLKLGGINFTSGGGEIAPLLGKINKWNKYQFLNCYLHIEQSAQDRLELLTVGKD
jgi:hypothetical protein